MLAPPIIAFKTSQGVIQIELNALSSDSAVAQVAASHILELAASGALDATSVTCRPGASSFSIGASVTVGALSPFALRCPSLPGTPPQLPTAAQQLQPLLADGDGCTLYRGATGEPPLGPLLEDAKALPLNRAWSVAVAYPNPKAPGELIINVTDNAALDKGSVAGVVCGRLVSGRDVARSIVAAAASTTHPPSGLKVTGVSPRTDLLPRRPLAVFRTSLGSFTAELFADMAPLLVSSFTDLAKKGFYNGQHFHRVIQDFIVQTGCPHSISPKARNAGQGAPEPNSSFVRLYEQDESVLYRRDVKGKLADEHLFELSNEYMTLSMANSGPNTCGSQFFVNVRKSGNQQLDWFNVDTKMQHAVFGRVVAGCDTIEKIAHVKTKNEVPLKPVQLESVDVQL